MEERLSTKIYNQIREKIDAGLLDGRTFLSESKLADEFGVSKAPIRDALHLLCSQGYLVSYPRKGYMVNVFTAEEEDQIQIIRKQLERLCVRLVIENATDAEIASLREFTNEQSNATDPAKTNNMQFHTKLAELTKNQYLPEILTPLIYKSSRFAMRSHSDLDSHNKIIEALLERNVTKAEQCIDEDIQFAAKYL